METRFDMDNFEKTLKEHADQFSMIPSKRVWNGVYNSLHPGSIWPSLTMLLFFLLTLVGIGPLNQTSKNYTVSTLPDNTENSLNEENESKVFSMNNYLKAENSFLTKESSILGKKSTGKLISLLNSEDSKNVQKENVDNKISINNNGDGFDLNHSPQGNMKSISNVPAFTEKILQKQKSESNVSALPALKAHIDKADISSVASVGIPKQIISDKSQSASAIVNETIIFDESRILQSLLKSGMENHILLEVEEVYPDSDIPSTTPIPSSAGSAIKKLVKRKSKTTWIFFATPSITTTYFTGKPIEGQNPLINSSPLLVNPNQIGNTMRFNARVGLNIGTEMNHAFSENWEIVTGIQLSYSGYNILAHKVHPSFSFLYLRNEENSIEPKKYITYYGSGEGLDEAVLHNNSIQLSLPVGLKYSVWKNNNVEIKIGTSLQPSLIVNAQAYILSSDGRNYVTDPDLMRNVNISGELNSSISFQGDKVKWHVGPTIRYQALSSYKNIYPVNEHLIDYGIRIGISK